MNYYNYFTEIEEAFVRRRGKHLLLSPLDWAMIEGWQDRGVPLHVVIRGIETVFDAFDKKPSNRSIKGLLYCREEIEAQYAEWLASQAGASETAAESSVDLPQVSTMISDAIQALDAIRETALTEDIARARARLTELAEQLPDDPETLDGTLRDIESFIERSLLEHSEPAVLDEISGTVEAELAAYSSTMEPDVFKDTLERMMLKRLRERHSIPRLGLFYL